MNTVLCHACGAPVCKEEYEKYGAFCELCGEYHSAACPECGCLYLVENEMEQDYNPEDYE